MTQQEPTSRKRRRGFSFRYLGLAVTAIAIGLMGFLQIYIFHQNDNLIQMDAVSNLFRLSREEFYQTSSTSRWTKKNKNPKAYKQQKSHNGEYRTVRSNDCEEQDEELLRRITKLEKGRSLGHARGYQKRKSLYAGEIARSTVLGSDISNATAIARATKLFVDLESDPSPLVENNDNDGPWLVLHIGPPKTATTTIQCGLEKYSLRLAKTDGYHFVGGGCGTPNQEYIMPNGEETILRRLVLMALHHTGIEEEGCGGPQEGNVTSESSALYREEKRLEWLQTQRHLEKFVHQIDNLRSLDRSVIVSGEQIGSQLSNRKAVMERTVSMLTSMSAGAGFAPDKVRIVLAYRHFVDWLPSFHYQKYLVIDSVMDRDWLTDRRRLVKPFLVYADEYLTNWEHHQKRVQKWFARKYGKAGNVAGQVEGLPLFPSGNSALQLLPTDRLSIHPSWWLYTLWSSYFPLPNQVQVYDMHSPMNMNRPGDDMVTDFICHMLPTAKKTCQRLMDEADGKANLQSDVNAGSGVNPTAADDLDYENLNLHSHYSYLHPDHTDENLNTGSIEGSSDANTTTGSSGKGGMNIRPSLDHHATRIVEALFARNEIKLFPYDEYDARRFEQEPMTPTDSLTVKGFTKSELVDNASIILENNGVYSKIPQANMTYEERFGERYFDCISPELEDRLLNASRTFLDLMYKHTPMLSLATAATYGNQEGLGTENGGKDWEQILAEEKEIRWAQAKEEHERLFEKNKKKGKYCDINPKKVFRNRPEVYDELVAMRFKPSFRYFRWSELPEAKKVSARQLGFLRRSWDGMKNAAVQLSEWKDLTPEKKASAFRLGWDEARWNKHALRLLQKKQDRGMT